MSIFDIFKRLEAQEKPQAGPPEWLIAGLGNPGKQYETTRHNAGFLALDTLSGLWRIPVTRQKFSALIGQGSFGGTPVLLMKPQKFMNLSGECIREAAAFYKLPMERVLVLYDDISLPVGRIRIRAKGSAGGHNGIKNIISQCNTDQFPRIKIGVGAPPHPDYDVVDWVLGSFSEADRKALIPALDRAVAAVPVILSDGVAQAANLYNSPGPEPRG